MDEKESEKYADAYKDTGKIAMGEWTALRKSVVDHFLKKKGRQNDGWIAGQESAVILISEEEWNALLENERAVAQKEKSAKQEAEKIQSDRIESASAGRKNGGAYRD